MSLKKLEEEKQEVIEEVKFTGEDFKISVDISVNTNKRVDELRDLAIERLKEIVINL